MTDEEPKRSASDDAANAVPALPTNYQAVLQNVIVQAEQDPARVRALVYELARINLKREALGNYPQMKRSEAERQMAELERAIEHVESSAEDDRPRASPPAVIAPPSIEASELIVPERPPRWLDNRVRVSLEPAQDVPLATRRGTSGFNAVLQFIGTAAIGILLFAILTGQIDLGRLFNPPATAPAVSAAAQKPAEPAGAVPVAQTTPVPPPSPPPAPELPYPLPSSYGVYALSEGRLYELESLPLKVPDPRIQMSAEITTPSVTTVPGPDLQFLVFRRDLASSAPSRIPVRVVAQVLREMSFKDGVAVNNKVEGAWRVRSQSLDLRVTPVPGQREMIHVQPEPGITLPPGRYVLVLGGAGHDFTVAGEALSQAHCLEKFDAVSGPMFAECRSQ